jgi:hypothetical protein
MSRVIHISIICDTIEYIATKMTSQFSENPDIAQLLVPLQPFLNTILRFWLAEEVSACRSARPIRKRNLFWCI